MILHGRNILLLAGGTAIAAAKSCELNVSADIIKTASPSDGAWENAIAGRKSWRVTCNQLVTGITNSLAMVGSQVTMRMQLKGQLGLPFSGFVDNPTVESGTLRDVPDDIYWDTTRHRFLGYWLDFREGNKYYTSWPDSNDYASPSIGKQFYMDSNRFVYKKGTTDLVPEALQGTAIVKDWKITATLGNLAQGSFQFQGVGALEVPTT